jgi:CRISPR-associated protein Csb1
MINSTNLAVTVDLHAGIRRVRRLQPTGGVGDKIFPPTYPGERSGDPPRHVFETRRIKGEDRRCVLLDSVQSQANRLEEALLEATRAGRITLPHVEVNFLGREAAGAAVGDLGVITSLDAPHRVFDAILRDSELDGAPFMRSAIGQQLQEAKPRNATALFEASPSALLFGAWNSTGEGGGLGAKFTRSIVSEIIAVGVELGSRTGSRIDPLGIRRDVEVYRTPEGDWTLEATAAGQKPKRVRPSEINHGNIAPSVTEMGVTADYAVHTAVISLAGLRRLSFPDGAGVVTSDRDNVARTVLAALGLVALCEQDRQGYALRSRCDLVPEGPAPFELVKADGSVESFDIDASGAARLLEEAVAAAEAVGLVWNPEPIRLTPQQRLVELVALSRRKALLGEVEPGENS